MNDNLVFPVYDKRTGEQLPQPVPRKWLGHPVHGQHITETPPASAAGDPKANKAATERK